jgi:hypothetical protein
MPRRVLLDEHNANGVDWRHWTRGGFSIGGKKGSGKIPKIGRSASYPSHDLCAPR